MKAVILYASKHGATKAIAEKIAARVPGAQLVNIKTDPIPDLAAFDCIALGAPVYAGQIPKAMRVFAERQQAALQGKRIGLFLSGLADSQEEAYFNMPLFPVEVVAAARSKRLLGSIYDPAKCNFFERFIIRMVTKQSGALNTIKQENIDAFAREWIGELA